ncbi:TlpA disulfide reductase family protein [Pseudooceanicola sp. HF7]|uniref:TlpA disulfide reductase family protein n=1 Tax=Pseudooceanicola sp. HF7 TaxID=2721560 RepID=UPI001431F604|nr:TlpA disulfide reductase family protein [Pseudooceanicola sp. HF7]NIZ08326.1 TlpA family protein disulfide reductase [Pseudooceanicola sp. HF7]
MFVSLQKRLRSALVYTGLGLCAIFAPLPAVAQELDPALITGEMRKLTLTSPAKQLATDLPWQGPEGTGSLGDYAGKWLVLNFWATWCAPCKEEMPTLAALQERRGGDDFAVVTLASGPNPPEAVAQFLESTGADGLPQWRDPKAAQGRGAAVLAMPVTLILDPEGREVARLIGGADWDAPEAHAVLDAFAATN